MNDQPPIIEALLLSVNTGLPILFDDPQRAALCVELAQHLGVPIPYPLVMENLMVETE